MIIFETYFEMYYICYRWFWINKIRFKLKLIDWLIFRKIRFNKNWKIEKNGTIVEKLMYEKCK